MKKLLVISTILLGFSAICFGNSTTYTSEYKAPILKTSLEFTASYANGKVTTSWKNIDIITTKGMKRYKVIKSSTNHFPVYPEDGYIQAISDRSQVNFTETNPRNGTYYYRVCAIMEDMNRYCSNVIELNINKTETMTSEPKPTTIPTTPIATSLTTNLKTMIDGFVVAFMDKLNGKYPDNLGIKTTIVDTLINKIDTIATGKSTALFTYLKERLQEQSYILKLQSLLDI
ncbi:MAG: hypothetical protein WC010_03330 [Candidatus Absconditabacterales bacterium]